MGRRAWDSVREAASTGSLFLASQRERERRALRLGLPNRERTHLWAEVARTNARPERIMRENPDRGDTHINDRSLLDSDCQEYSIKGTGVRLKFAG